MPPKLEVTTKEKIVSTPIPSSVKTMIADHEMIITKTLSTLEELDLMIISEQYKSNLSGNIAMGVYLVQPKDSDTMPENTLTFVWTNSYDKPLKFKCSVGITDSSTVFLTTTESSYISTNSITETFKGIEDTLKNYENTYNGLNIIVGLLEKANIDTRKKAEYLGRLYMEEDILTISQVASTRREIENPTHPIPGLSEDSLYQMYSYLGVALKESHPSKYIEDHIRLSQFFLNELGSMMSSTPVMEKPETVAPIQEPKFQNKRTSRVSTVIFS